MPSDHSWTLKGLPPALQEAAIEAARSQGVTVEEWLRAAMAEPTLAGEQPQHQAAPAAHAQPYDESPKGSEAPAPARRSGRPTINSRLDDLSRQIEALSRRQDERPSWTPRADPQATEMSERLRLIEHRLSTLSGSSAPAPVAVTHQLTETLTNLDRRLESIMQESRSASDELERRIAAVDSALNALNRPGAPPPASPPPPAAPTAVAAPAPAPVAPPAEESSDWTFGLDRAVAEIAERQRALDTEPPSGSLQRQFAALSQRLKATPRAGAEPAGAIAATPPPERAPAPAEVPARAETPVRAEPAAPAKAVESADAAGLQSQIRALTEELHVLRLPGGFVDTFGMMRQELAEIGRTLTDAAPRRAVQALEAQVKGLSDRLVHERGRNFDPTVLLGIEQHLDDLRGTLTRFAPDQALAAIGEEVRALDQKIETIAAGVTEAASHGPLLRQLERSVGELREIASRAASSDALISIAEEVQALGERLDRLDKASHGETPEISSLLERRFEELAGYLDGRSQARDSAAADRLSSLVEHLAGKLEQAELGGESAPMLDSIAGQLTRLTQHIEAHDARAGSLDHFEQSIRDLLAGMDDLRATAIGAAEMAAKDAIALIARQASAAPPPEVDALRYDFDSLRQNQALSDRRTQDTLEAVHDTLERLVDRLAVVETDVHRRYEPPVAAAEPAPVKAVPPAMAPAVAPPPLVAQAAAAAEPTRRASAELPAVHERRPIDPTLPADHPLEPGTAAARARSPSSAAERIAASEAALGPARPPAEGEAKSNFIAAARRAAQAAANMAPPPDAAPEREKGAVSSFGALAKKLTGRRSLMLAAILVLSAGALALAFNGVGQRVGERFAAKPPAKIAAAPERPTAIVRAEKPAAAPAPAMPAPFAAKPAPPAPPAAPPSEPSAPPDPAKIADAAPPPAPSDGAVPTVSPLTIASVQLPAGELTGALGRATGVAGKPDAAAAKPPPAQAALPPAPTDPLNAFGPGLRNAALAGNAAAEYEIATRYAEGRGVATNFGEAARWFERAANRGLAPAQYRLGSLYEKGQGVRKDLDQARRLYRAASDSGSAKAMHNLAVLYAEGIDGKPDFKLAAEWFRKAATRGIADSQYNLGILYARGLGVDQNLAESFKWFALAAQQGDKEAGKKRDDVAARLDQQGLIAARLAVQTFVAEPQPEEATTVKAPASGWEAGVAPPAREKRKPGPRSPRRSKTS